ncbi:hypothetical protein [Hyalangium minutum]|uniref:Uncharacterized protein n=1 Tax=Hyalangium minutum TaxID=394096 RepID=A0A085VZ63_9BACT|nr:hypothetical protein [Hyalangium minutum]KFE60726.1 hypothetical protein DB31_4639 [Hyalangium minutum]
MLNRLSRYGLLLALLVAFLAPATQAQAPQRDRIALHPCVITGGKQKNISDLEALCATAAARESMNLVPSTEVRAFLEKENGSCAKAKNRNACLGRLAAATKATRTLYITLNPFTPKSTRITGLVVDDAGKKVEEKPLELPRIPNQPPSDVIRFAVAALLEQLNVAKAPDQESLTIPLTPGATPEPVAVPSPTPESTSPTVTAPPQPAPVASVKQEAPKVRTWKTPAGISGIAVGGVGLIASGILLNSANSKAEDFNNAFEGKLPENGALPDLVKLRDEAKSGQRTAAIATGVSGALAIGGAILWLMDGSASSEGTSSTGKVGTTRILAGPGQVGLSVLLP